MKTPPSFLPVLLLALASIACSKKEAPPVAPADPAAHPATARVLTRLQEIRQQRILVGHVDDPSTGVLWRLEAGRSDVYETAGAFPAVVGWDLGGLESGLEANNDGIPFSAIQEQIREAHKAGALIVLTWSMKNPRTGGAAWDTLRALNLLVPGAEKHADYTAWLDAFSTFLQPLTDAGGNPVPVIFRPFHENTAGWFWWGRKSCTPDDFKALWAFTFQHLTQTRGHHNLLWLYSPAQVRLMEFERWYPGGNLVDLIGLSDYGTWTSDTPVDGMKSLLEWLEKTAAQKNKVPVLAETGLAAIPDASWFTATLLQTLDPARTTARPAYIMFGRNAPATQLKDHYFVPHKDHPAAADFKQFRESGRPAFRGDIDLYAAAAAQ